MEQQHLHHPLLSTANSACDSTTTATSSTATIAYENISLSTTTSCIVQRLLLIIFVGVISVWANNEASKGFEIRVLNDMKGTPVGVKFSLFYVSNDEATRLVQTATISATKILHLDANSMPEKIIEQIVVRLIQHNLTNDYVVVTKSHEQKNTYVLSVSPLIMEFGDFKRKLRKEIQRAMAEVLLFDKRDRAPETLVNGLVKYMSNQEGLNGLNPVFKSRNFSGRCWEHEDSKVVAYFIRNCERISEGFIGRLYQSIGRDEWDEHTVDNAMGMIATPLCESTHFPIAKNDDMIAEKVISTYR